MLSVGLSWSEYGGVSASAFGLSISSRGVDFNPSISLSYAFLVKQPPVVRNTSSNNSGQGSATGNTTSGNKIDNVNTYYKVQSSSNSCSIGGNGAGGSGTASNEWDNVGTLREVKLFGQTYLERSDGSWEPSQAGYTTLPEVTVTSYIGKSMSVLEASLTTFSLSTDIKDGLLSTLGYKLPYLKAFGHVLSITNATLDLIDIIFEPNKRTLGNFVNFGIDVGLIWAGPAAGIIKGLLDASGTTKQMIYFIDKKHLYVPAKNK